MDYATYHLLGEPETTIDLSDLPPSQATWPRWESGILKNYPTLVKSRLKVSLEDYKVGPEPIIINGVIAPINGFING